MNQHSRTEKQSVRALAFLAIQRIEADKAYTDIVLSHLFSANLSYRDKAFLSELVRGTIRWKKNLDWIVDQLLRTKNKVPEQLRWILWLGLYQIRLMSRVPNFAAVNESVTLAKKFVGQKWAGVVNGVLRSFIRNPTGIKYPTMNSNPVKSLALRKSFPEWLIKRWINQIGIEETQQLCDAFNEAPSLSVRINSLRTNAEAFENLLDQKKIEYKKSIVRDFYLLKKIPFAFQTEFLNTGLITIQDESAGLPGLLLDPRPDDVIFDLCAAPGGKSFHAAELADDSVKIISGDINVSRIDLLKKTKMRLGIHSVQLVAADAKHFPAGPADKVLLDAPCSGLGVIRKKPDLRWRKSEKGIRELVFLQRKLLEEAARLVKIGGHLIYSTCTMAPEENEDMMNEFLQNNPQFEIPSTLNRFIPKVVTSDGFIKTWPHRHNMDGSFAAIMVKKYESEK
ncbi:MAG: 16S rRNA (cytosine(967)-C(5))-methyltransferase RsmB [Calditrichaeota bacterium]|nr:16S rRNA (cytosine(967)-C(5))-methyltransferase RsmB [Calditrichota bacterium]